MTSIQSQPAMVNAWLGCFAQAAPWVLGSGLKGAWSCSQIESQSRQGANSGGWDCLHVAEGVGDGSRESWGPEPSAFVVVSIKARRSTAGDLLSPGTHCIWASYFSRTASCRPWEPIIDPFILFCFAVWLLWKPNRCGKTGIPYYLPWEFR